MQCKYAMQVRYSYTKYKYYEIAPYDGAARVPQHSTMSMMQTYFCSISEIGWGTRNRLTCSYSFILFHRCHDAGSARNDKDITHFMRFNMKHTTGYASHVSNEVIAK